MADEQLEPLGEPGVFGTALGQGGDLHRVHGDEGGLDQLLLHPLVKAGVQGIAPGGLGGFRQFHTHSLGGGHGLGIIGDGAEIDAHILTDSVDHGQAAPAGSQIDLLAHPLHFIGAQDLLGGAGEDTLGNIHHTVEVSVRLIQLHSGKLGIVLGIHALVAEDAADLIHTVHAAHDQPLQRQLRGDTHVHIDIQGVVVGDEGPGGGAAGNGVQDRGFHLDIAHVVQVVPHELDELGADDEVPLHLGIDHQVHIPLAVAQLPVLQAVELLRQGQQGFGEQGDVLGPDAHLAPLGAEDLAVHADNITDVVLLEFLIDFLVHLVLAGVELDAAIPVLKVAEADLAHAALAHQAAGHLHALALHGVEIVLDLLGGVVPVKPGLLEGILALGLEGGQLFPPDLPLLVQVLLGGGLLIILLFRHMVSPYPLVYRSIFRTV